MYVTSSSVRVCCFCCRRRRRRRLFCLPLQFCEFQGPTVMRGVRIVGRQLCRPGKQHTNSSTLPGETSTRYKTRKRGFGYLVVHPGGSGRGATTAPWVCRFFVPILIGGKQVKVVSRKARCKPVRMVSAVFSPQTPRFQMGRASRMPHDKSQSLGRGLVTRKAKRRRIALVDSNREKSLPCPTLRNPKKPIRGYADWTSMGRVKNLPQGR